MPLFTDTSDLPEDDRILLIGETAMKRQGLTAFITDDEEGKADRYVRKLLATFPGLEVLDRFDGPVPNTVTVRVRKKR